MGSLYILVAHAMAQERNPDAHPGTAFDNGPIRRTAKMFVKFSDYFAQPARERFDDSEFRHGRATSEYPEIPGEEGRNRELSEIRRSFNRHRGDSDAASTRSDLSRQNSGLSIPKGGEPNESDAESTPETPLPQTPKLRRDTLEVPSPARRTSGRDNLSASAISRTSATPPGQSSPAIVVSSNVDTPYPEHVLL